MKILSDALVNSSFFASMSKLQSSCFYSNAFVVFLVERYPLHELFPQTFCQYACPHHQSNRLVACSANFVSLGGHALRGKSSTLNIDPL